ncbi:hypothetical protein I551_3947 [Mycobacterium ulcerans str. Harvey]|uniref:PE-PGRS family domain protein n=1 Tax=Mycobacterium ulcerans str. Harvey TaxID=1299332 RepID=A0ABP3AI41_MYCUL|nr:hypothetical protein I551_3947 [Mycobacterium ulcerans str. Harvey]
MNGAAGGVGGAGGCWVGWSEPAAVTVGPVVTALPVLVAPAGRWQFRAAQRPGWFRRNGRSGRRRRRRCRWAGGSAGLLFGSGRIGGDGGFGSNTGGAGGSGGLLLGQDGSDGLP